MCRRLADGRYAIVAANAIAADIDVIEIRRKPTDSRMAIIAVIAARYMCRVLAGRNGTIMTRAAGAQNLSMIDACGGLESDRAMAVLTNIRGLHVQRALSRGGYAIVA